MKSLYIVAIFSFLTVGCHPDDDAPTPPTSMVGKEFQPYFEEFIQEMNKRAPDSTIDFSNFIIRFSNTDELDTGVYGACPKLGGKEVIIAKSYWEVFDTIYQKALIYHELGHCALRRMHDSQFFRFYTCVVGLKDYTNFPDIKIARSSLTVG